MDSRWENIARNLPYAEEDIQPQPVDQEALSKWEKIAAAGKSTTPVVTHPESKFKLEQDMPIRKAISDVYRPVLETTGLVAGGAAGSGVGSVATAGVGYGIAKKTADILDNLVGLRKPKTILEELAGSAQDIAEGAMMEMGGQAVGKIAGKILSPVKEKMTPAAKISEQEAKEAGITLTPGEITGSKTQQLFESLMDKTPFASSVTQEWRLQKQLNPLIKARNRFLETGEGNQQNVEVLGLKIKDAIDKHITTFGKAKETGLNAMRNSMLKRMGSQEGYEALGKDVQEILASKSVAAVAKKNRIYKEISKSIPEGDLKFTSFDDESKAILDKIKELPNQPARLKNILAMGSEQTGKDAKIIEELSQYPEKVQQSIAADMGTDLTAGASKSWETMQRLRSQISELIKAEDLSVKMNAPHLKGQLSNEGRLYKNLKVALDKDFERLSKEAGADAFEKMKIANVFFEKEYAPVWKSKLIQKMAYTSPEKVVDVAFKPGSVAEIRLAKKALGDKGFKPLQTSFTNKLLGVGKDGVFKPKALMDNISKYGDEMLAEVYKPKDLYALKDLATTGKLFLEKKLPGQNILRTIASNSPNTVVDSILGSAERMPGSKSVLQNITTLKPFLKKSEVEGLREAFSERLFKINQTTNMVQPIQLSKTIKTYDRVLPKFYKPEEIAFLKKVANTGQRLALAEASAANPSGTAQNVIAWTVFGAVLIAPVNELMKGDLKGTAATGATGIASAVLLPKYMAKMALSKAGRKYFTEGLLTKASTKKGIELATKIITSISRSKKQDQTNKGDATNGTK